MWQGLIHAADLIRQPLLPAHDMLAAAISAVASAPEKVPDSGHQLLQYARACLMQDPAHSAHVHPSRDTYTAQMCMLAFILWTNASYFRQVAPPAVADRMQVRDAAVSSCSYAPLVVLHSDRSKLVVFALALFILDLDWLRLGVWMSA